MTRCLGLARDDQVVEIGPGTGVLTERLLQHLDFLTVVELDRDLVKFLDHKFASESLKIVQQDILNFDLSDLFSSSSQSDEAQLRIVGNLPYNISTPLLFHLIESIAVIRDMLFMVQKEVALRLCANPGGKHYGRLSVMSQLSLNSQILFEVAPAAFNPPPKVDSAVVRLIPKQENASINDMIRFRRLVKMAFSQRRKTLRNSLKSLVTEEQFLHADISSSWRAENLGVDDFIRLANT